jgi:hypothetical protein
MAISLIWLLRMRQLVRLLCGNVGLSNQRRSSLLKQGRALWCSLMVFADMLERCLKLATTITVARYYCDNEELGMAYFLNVFT